MRACSSTLWRWRSSKHSSCWGSSSELRRWPDALSWEQASHTLLCVTGGDQCCQPSSCCALGHWCAGHVLQLVVYIKELDASGLRFVKHQQQNHEGSWALSSSPPDAWIDSPSCIPALPYSLHIHPALRLGLSSLHNQPTLRDSTMEQHNEGIEQSQATQPTLCASGCGFFA
jgi:hypothetical protein